MNCIIIHQKPDVEIEYLAGSVLKFGFERHDKKSALQFEYNLCGSAIAHKSYLSMFKYIWWNIFYHCTSSTDKYNILKKRNQTTKRNYQSVAITSICLWMPSAVTGFLSKRRE